MTELGYTLALGFWLGMRHAGDADHVVAVSTLVARNKRFGASWLLGAFWGLGHTVTVFAVGAAIIAFHVTIPPRVGLGMEFCVGVVLVLLGFLNLGGLRMGSWGVPRHAHPHSHDDPEHRHELLEASHPHAAGRGHAHSHAHLREARLEWLRRMIGDTGAFQLARSAAVGLVHGLAGSAAVALLVLATIPEPRLALGYLAVFGVGTLAGMLVLSALMELAMLTLARRWSEFERGLGYGTGLVSFLFGCYVLYRTGVVDGLFTAAPRWTPQ
ncbi:MAG: high-affinity nickel-transport family protein [Elusimicrobia bacterium]|nr:high-affinity nickel-transport family protein [Elusimicrobiota bacterium]